MDYSADPWWVYVVAVVGVFGVVIGLPIFGIYASGRRARRQSVSIKQGAVYVIDSAFGGEKAIPADTIGTVVYLRERESSSGIAPLTSVPLATSGGERGQDYRNMQARAVGNGADMFEYGGLIILNTRGRMVGHVAYEVGSGAPMGEVWKQIPAANHVEFPRKAEGAGYSRRAFKKAFPRALRFGEFWGASRWTWTIVAFVFLGLPVLGFLALFVIVFIQTLMGMNG